MANYLSLLKKADKKLKKQYDKSKREHDLLEVFFQMKNTSEIRDYSPSDVLAACEYFIATAETRERNSKSADSFVSSLVKKPRMRTRRLF